MRRRILTWAVAGFLVACGWTAYAFATAPDIETVWSTSDHIIWAIACTTCPVLLAESYVPVYFPWILSINTLTYAAVGLVIQYWRRGAN